MATNLEGRSSKTVAAYRHRLGLKRKPKGRDWSSDEIWFLKKYYPSRPASWIAEILGKSKKAVYQKAQDLGLKKETSQGQ